MSKRGIPTVHNASATDVSNDVPVYLVNLLATEKSGLLLLIAQRGSEYP